jgi:preprotein translocase subunit SecG
VESAIIIVHVVMAIAIIGLVLIQQGKGADAGASFGGGASQTVFGASGSGNFLTKTTSILAVVFFVTSFALAVIAKNKAESVGSVGLPTVTTPADVPAQAPAAPAGDLPE